jgi:hypothetical protein
LNVDAAAADVARLWGKGEACALTGIAFSEFLIASHIKPWRGAGNAERLDPTNVLLSAVHVDKLFDRHLLSLESQAGDLPHSHCSARAAYRGQAGREARHGTGQRNALTE